MNAEKNIDPWAFYAAFEDKYRGSFEQIKDRVATYLPDVLRQPEQIRSLLAVDIGCGRGEWLTLLKDNGVRAVGVDQNPVTAAQARKAELDVHTGDALEYLSTLTDRTCRIISAFHVIEHISWQSQLKIFHESYRTLASGGLLIVEWPNIENHSVSTQNFWMDPTHIRPLPVDLITFMAEYVGFEKIKTLRFRPNRIKAPITNKELGQGFIRRLLARKCVSILIETPELSELVDRARAGRDIAIVCEKA